MVLRHAKSGHSDPRLSDHERPLNDRGRQAAPRVGRRLNEHELLPDRILCSTAARTVETMELLLGEGDQRIETERLDELYLASARTILETVVMRGGDADRVLVIGHNPGMEDVLHLLGLGIREMPTATLARIGLEIDDWALATAGPRVELLDFWLARDLTD